MHIYTVFEPPLQLPKDLDASRLFLDDWHIKFHFLEEMLDGAHGVHRAQKIGEVAEIEHGAAFGFCQGLADIEDAAQRR